MSIQKRGPLKDGTYRWDVRGRVGGAGAAQPSVTCKTKAEARRVHAEMERQSGLGAFGRGLPSKQPVGDYLADWFDRERHGWATSTRRQRRDVLDRWVDPYLTPRLRLADFAEKAVAEWLGSIRAAGASPTQTRAALSIVSSALGAAKRDGLIERNPCVGVRLPAPVVARPASWCPSRWSG